MTSDLTSEVTRGRYSHFCRGSKAAWGCLLPLSVVGSVVIGKPALAVLP